MISDSGSACEELPLIDTPVIVPRDYTERPQSYASKCSIPVHVEEWDGEDVEFVDDFVENQFPTKSLEWLGNGTTSDQVIAKLQDFLSEE